ncbi:cob(I)yrinic acid a,c-diamide adenosyltransferase [Anaerosinus gibii]|uniref:Cob(I)yrinic acid a,c-diamide adenosyltransferase n=1 Tax=Selenobaculum gibii TaxID=3054208 RepID=A0A9Y2EU50_9FIRM|nr:cob(I)yrinic acid a,c-diamide adenosyltransferase [Selenobaculum gbiensis]WIW71150.1 cob(I)yrinic acid a,c-diamide adenosyltransferase [Selenobaculum gbiensis]
MKFKGYVQVYTGDGKGKTTAAIGLAIRALGAGKRVCFLQFMKNKSYSEHCILNNLSRNLTVKTFGKPFFIAKKEEFDRLKEEVIGEEIVVFKSGFPPREYVALIHEGMEVAKRAVQSGDYDIVILDEVIVAVYFELIAGSELDFLIQNKLDSVELVLTGRKASKELIEKADLVTEMKEIKHYYTNGIEARVGIEN